MKDLFYNIRGDQDDDHVWVHEFRSNGMTHKVTILGKKIKLREYSYVFAISLYLPFGAGT